VKPSWEVQGGNTIKRRVKMEREGEITVERIKTIEEEIKRLQEAVTTVNSALLTAMTSFHRAIEELKTANRFITLLIALLHEEDVRVPKEVLKKIVQSLPTELKELLEGILELK
jgi:predicted transcriptional regulator